jgi:hypothetical protein
MPTGLLGHRLECWLINEPGRFNPRLLPTFSFSRRSFSAIDPLIVTEARHPIVDAHLCNALVGDRSTGSKQTLNGLFYVNGQSSFL